LAVTRPGQVRLQVTCPELMLADFGLKRPHQPVALGIGYLVRGVEHVIQGFDFFAHKLFDPVQFALKLWFGFEIPTHLFTSLAWARPFFGFDPSASVACGRGSLMCK